MKTVELFYLPGCPYCVKARKALEELRTSLKNLSADVTAEEEQSAVFEVGKHYEFENLRAWFMCLYKNLLGQEEGPRMGSFIVLYGVQNTIKLIDDALSR